MYECIQGYDIWDLHKFTKCVTWEKMTISHYSEKMKTTEENNRDKKCPGYTAIVLWMKTNGWP